eukprot:2997559-Rhodomonas_salina.1
MTLDFSGSRVTTSDSKVNTWCSKVTSSCSNVSTSAALLVWGQHALCQCCASHGNLRGRCDEGLEHKV